MKKLFYSLSAVAVLLVAIFATSCSKDKVEGVAENYAKALFTNDMDALKKLATPECYEKASQFAALIQKGLAAQNMTPEQVKGMTFKTKEITMSEDENEATVVLILPFDDKAVKTSEGIDEAVEDAVEEMAEKTEEVVEKAAESMEEAAEKVEKEAEKVDEATEKPAESVEEAAEKVEEVAGAEEKADEAADKEMAKEDKAREEFSVYLVKKDGKWLVKSDSITSVFENK